MANSKANSKSRMLYLEMDKETLKECLNLLEGALEFYECEKPECTVTIKNIKSTYKQLSNHNSDFRLTNGIHLKVYQVKLIEKLDKENAFGSRFTFDIDSRYC